MTFQPRMQSRVDNVTVVGDLHWRAWTGAVADVWNVECAPGATGEYVSPDPRVFIVLDKAGEGDVHLSEAPDRRVRMAASEGETITYIPAGMTVRSHLENVSRLRHLDVHFDLASLAGRLGEELDTTSVQTPRFAFADERIMALAQLIAAECTSPSGLHDLYGDSLTTALATAVLQVKPREERRRGQMSGWLLRRAIDFIEANCQRNIRLQELADLTGLSQSYFCRAFKASTGMPPHQWQMRARVERSKQLLLSADVSLTEIAMGAGFADQAHFTRVFRRMVGTTPANWQRHQGAITLPGADRS